MTKKALGKGLTALIADNRLEELDQDKIEEIDIKKIEPNSKQPRKYFEEQALQELAESIRLHGILQPLLVKQAEGYYELVAGERRWRAARLAGIKKVPVIIRTYSEQEALEISLIENIQREDLNPIEEALSYKRLVDEFGLSQEKVAEKVGKSRSTVTNSMRLLNLEERVQIMVMEGQLSNGHARTLLALSNKAQQYEISKKIVAENLSVRETELLVKKIQEEKVAKKKSIEPMQPIYRHIEDQFKQILGTKVLISKGKNKGRIEIEYYSDSDLERLLGLIQSIEQ